MSIPAQQSEFKESMSLMHQMGASSFDPMPPAQHAYLMDRDQPLQNRHIGWCFSKTIHPTPNESGKGFKRWARCHDERGWLKQNHCSVDLGVAISNTVSTFTLLAEQGRIRIDEKGHIWVRGDVQKPNLVPKGEQMEKDKRTYNLPDELRLYFQSLDSERRTQYTRDWNQLQEHAERIHRDAIALAREQAAELEHRWRVAIGFTRPKRGRPTKKAEGKRPEPVVEIELKALPPLSVHISGAPLNGHSVRNGNGHVYGTENGSEHKAASLSGLRVDESCESEVNPGSVENRAPEQNKAAPAAQPSGSVETLAEEVEKLNAIRAELEIRFGHKLRTADTVPADFRKLEQRLGLPSGTMLRWIHAKMTEKKGLGYHVSSAGALRDFAVEDVPKWIKLNRALIHTLATQEDRERVRQVHEEAARAAGAGEAFDPLGYGPTMEDLKQKTRMK